MPRGQGHFSLSESIGSRSQEDYDMRLACGLIKERIKEIEGVHILSKGYLEEDFAGHASGSIVIKLFAPTLEAAARTRDSLEDISGLNDMAWQYGWVVHKEDGLDGLNILLYPLSNN